ncbi:MAG: spirocyclase AveC family protein [bacterium]
MTTISEPVSVEGKAFHPVLFWAGVGIFWYLVVIYSMSQWITTGSATFVDPGVDIPSKEMVFWIVSFDIMGPIMALWVTWKFAIKPKLKTGRFSSDGILLFAFFLMFWQDPMLAYNSPWFLYNSLHFNLGNWVEFVPGGISPYTRYVSEPLLTWSTGYIFFMMWPVLFICWCMRRWKIRRPDTGTFGLVCVAFLAGISFDLVMEYVYLHTGGYNYAGSIRDWSLFGGEMWQFPIYDIFFWGGTWALCAVWRFFKDDKGYMFCEQGVDKLKVSEGKRTFIRFLAISGLMQSTMMFMYNMPMHYFSVNGDPFPEGYPSYLLNGMCGEGTQHACPAPSIPLSRGAEGMSVGPDLKLHNGELSSEEIYLKEITN